MYERNRWRRGKNTVDHPPKWLEILISTVAQVLTNAATDTLMRKEYFPW